MLSHDSDYNGFRVLVVSLWSQRPKLADGQLSDADAWFDNIEENISR